MMKNYFSFLLVFIFLLGSGQKFPNKNGLERKEFEKCENIENNFKNVDFSSLYRKIVNDIELDEKKINLIIRYRQLPEIAIEELNVFEPYFCNYVNPVFNQSHFWNAETIKLIQEKYNVNIIPNLTYPDVFINRKTTRANVNLDDKAIAFFLKQKKTKISGGYSLDKNKKYVSFPKDKDSRIDIQEENTQTLEIEFENEEDKIVKIWLVYPLERIFKTYQYQNENWVEMTND